MHDRTTASSSDPVRSSPEIHGYDSLDRLEQQTFDRAPRISTDARAESAYDQFWLGEESSYLGQ
jgi:hypothetical protein